MLRKVVDSEGIMFCEGYSIYQHSELMVGKFHAGKYCVVALNSELYNMQCGDFYSPTYTPHPICVVDNFGNLVRVA